jgi:NitT/TauT family transport system permease protein
MEPGMTSTREIVTTRLGASPVPRPRLRRPSRIPIGVLFRKVFSLVNAVRVLILLALLGLWQLISVWAGSLWVSTPDAVMQRYRQLFDDGSLVRNSLVTLREAGVGLVLGTAIGLVLGIVISRAPRLLSKAIDPYILGAYSLPRVALAPFFILWFGIGFTSKIALVISVVGFVVLFNVRQGIESIDPDMLDALRSMRAGRIQMTRQVVIPSVVPWLMAAIKISVGMALVSAVVGELIGSTEGLGWYMTQSMNQFDITGGITALLTMAVLAMVMYAVVGVIERRVCRWQVAAVSQTVAM